MHKRTSTLYLNDIISAIEKILTYTKDIDFDTFLEDEKTIDAVLRNLEIIGEGVKNIPEDIKSKYPQITE
jgi:hypothetical protein